jgi:PKD repeat protein
LYNKKHLLGITILYLYLQIIRAFMRKINYICILILASLILVNPTSIVFSESEYQISGIVTNKNAERVRNIKIELIFNSKVIESDKTNMVGYYRIVEKLEDNTEYLLRVSGENIQTDTIAFETTQPDIVIDIIVNRNPVAVIDIPEIGYVNEELTFSGTDSYDPDEDILNFLWDYDDGETSQGETSTHAYSIPGDYTVNLTVSDNQGAKDSTSEKIEIRNRAPVVNINGPYYARVGQAVQFSSEGTYDPDNDLLSFLWDFGDSTTSVEPNPKHIYDEVKEYQVKLTIHDIHGAKSEADTKCKVQESLNPIANANGPYTGYVGIPIKLSSEGSTDPDGTIQSYLWEFDDGTKSEEPNPEKIFNDEGVYSLSLTITDNEGHEGTDSSTVEIVIPENVPPISECNGPYSGYVNRVIVFSSQGSIDPDGDMLEFNWDFGDGGNSAEANPRYSYSSPGIYEILLTVTDTDLYTNTDTTICTVKTAPPPSPSPPSPPPNKKPVAIGTFPLKGEVGEILHFSSVKSYDPDGKISKHLWIFGDGETSIEENPTHRYKTQGEYIVILTVTDEKGKKDSDEFVLLISEPNLPPILDLYRTIQGKTNEVIQFSPLECYDPDGEIIEYKWDFGDGLFSSLENPQHSYSSPGDFLLELSITDNSNATTKAFSEITITDNEPPVPIITSPNQTKVGEIITFSALSSYDTDGEIIQYEWDFGDGLSSALPEINYIFHEEGEKIVKLVIIDNDLTKNRIRKTIDILPNLLPEITVNKSRKGVVNEEIMFMSEAIDHDGEIVVTLWDFGDGTYAEGTSVSHNYTAPGFYSGSITVTDDNYESSNENIQIIIVEQESETILPLLTISVSLIIGIAYVLYKPWIRLIENI